MPAPKVVIVGASLAGLRSAEAVRSAIPEARITLIGEERHMPYNRPPLSKEAAGLLAGADAAACDLAFSRLALKHRLAVKGMDWRLGVRAVQLDSGGREVFLGDGSSVRYDWLIAATGLRPRRLPLAGVEDRRYVLRSFDDAVRLGACMAPGARMIVAGAGFIGCELASSAMKLGIAVVVVDPQSQPMHAALLPEVAAAMASFHRDKGVDLRCGVLVTRFTRTGVTLSDGTSLDGAFIVEAVGSDPNVEWLSGNRLDLTNGVLTDASLTANGADRILAVGDIARFPNGLFDRKPRRVEHWCVPGQTARRAAETIAAREAGHEPSPDFRPMPSFWSDQHGLRLQSFGAPELADEAVVVEGSLKRLGETPCIVEYRRAGGLVGVLGLGAPPAALAQPRIELERALSDSVAA